MSIQELPLQAQSNLIVTTHEITRIINTHVPMLYARNLFFAPPFIVHGNTAVSIESGRIVTRLPLGTIDTVTPYMDTAMGAGTRSSCAAVGSGCVEQSGAAWTLTFSVVITEKSLCNPW